jgi:hypothetical protein
MFKRIYGSRLEDLGGAGESDFHSLALIQHGTLSPGF